LYSKILRLTPWEPSAAPQELPRCCPIGDNRMSFCGRQFHTYFHCVRELHPSPAFIKNINAVAAMSVPARKNGPSGSQLFAVYEWLLVPKAGPFSLNDSYTPFSSCCTLQYPNHLQGSHLTYDQRRPCQDNVLRPIKRH
jgi:hypothetical protein